MSMDWNQLSAHLGKVAERVGQSVVQVGGHHAISGVVVAPDVVVTVAHAVRSSEVQVRLPDGEVRQARRIGADRRVDLALLRVQGGGLVPVTWSDAEVPVGALVLTLGRARGSLDLTWGLVSRTGGPWRTDGGVEVDRYLAVDASLPRGSSGGPLVDLAGGVIGLNTHALVRGGTTIPSSTVRRVVAELLERGSVEPGYLGVGGVHAELGALSAQAEGRTTAVVLASVDPEGPAGEAGVLVGDVVIAVADEPVAGLEGLLGALGRHGAGRSVKLGLLRGGQPLAIDVVLAARPERESRGGCKP